MGLVEYSLLCVRWRYLPWPSMLGRSVIYRAKKIALIIYSVRKYGETINLGNKM